ncbi:XRE family transcriptional regulator [Actinokineospora alba]|nr:XRE family transcriptional regulator [Actinokineospora alba]
MTSLADSPSGPAFGQVLLRYRTAARLSQSDMARLSGLSVRALRELEHGRASAAQERSAELLASALKLGGDERESFILLAKEGRRRSLRSGNRTMLYALPAAPALVGRERELEQLSRAAETGGVMVVMGPPGVGKTSLAVAAADRLTAQFPDGCLALDLRGVDDHPISAAAALERMLTTLGVPANRIPALEIDRSSLFRTLLRDRRVLVVLDNAADEAQVRPLLSSGERSLTIVTSRRSLAGLEAAHWLTLDVLPAVSSLDLLAEIVGDELVRGEPEAAAEVVRLCSNLPLAVRIVGNRLATRRHWSLAYLVRQLQDERTRLDSLSAGDLQLRSAFEVSLRRLSPGAQLVFRRLALVPGAHFDDDLATIATGVSPAEIDAYLDELVEASLLNVMSAPMRLQFHDLIRLFAGERLAADEPGDVRAQLNEGLCAYILEKTTAAGRLFLSTVSEVPADSPFQSQDAAKEWLDHEATNWLAALRQAAALGWHREVVDCTWTLHNYSHGRESRHRWNEVFEFGVNAARALGDRIAEVDLLTQLGSAYQWGLADSERALSTLRPALALAEEIDYRLGITIANSILGSTLLSLGQIEEGMQRSQRAYEMSTGYDFWVTRFWMTLSLGATLEAFGRFPEALALLSPLLSEAKSRADQTNPEMAAKVTVLALTHIGDCLAGLEHWDEAAQHFHEAAELTVPGQPAYHYHNKAELLLREGTAWRNAGKHQQARTQLSLAIDLFDNTVNRDERERAEAELALLPAEGATSAD